jgi:hypothetical protein
MLTLLGSLEDQKHLKKWRKQKEAKYVSKKLSIRDHHKSRSVFRKGKEKKLGDYIHAVW